MRVWVFISAMFVPLSAAALGVESPRLELRNALVTEAVAGSSAAVSGDLYNPADMAVTVVGADSPVAGQTLLQAYSSDSLGARQVRVLGKLEIPARGEVSLEPGVKELRLIGLKEDLRAGNELPLFFKTADGKVQALRVVIIKGYGQ